jgi:hypothetical protein
MFDCICGWFTTICCIDVPFMAGLTVYMVAYHDLLYRCTLYGRFDCIYGWFTTICCIDVPFKAGLTVYMVGLPRFVE